MLEELKKETPVMLGVSTQIDILMLLEKGYKYNDIDEILDVPQGSSRYTINELRKER